MKVLLVNTSDHIGGAAIAALRLLKALQKAGVSAKLLCRDHTLPESRSDVVSLKPTKWRKLKFMLERFEIFWHNGLSKQGLFAVDTGRWGNDITHLKEFKEADVIHLHWVNQAMLSLTDIQNILKSGKRVVWTMHDMWPFTGICHNADACQGWRKACGMCPMLQRPKENDLSQRTFAKKRIAYAAGRMTLVGCSRWLANLAAEAPLLRGLQVECVPNPIDTAYYAPAGSDGMPTQAEVRQALGLPQGKKLLLFAAFKVTDPAKGVDYLIKSIAIAVKQHPELSEKIALVIAGQGAWTLREAFAVPVYPMGYVTSEERMRQLYQAADLLLMPTQMDNLPNTIVEAMACGVPCVAFGVGGVPQMVDSGINGYLAAPRDAEDFARGISATLQSTSYAALCHNARSKALKAYSEKTVAQKFLQIYQSK